MCNRVFQPKIIRIVFYLGWVTPGISPSMVNVRGDVNPDSSIVKSTADTQIPGSKNQVNAERGVEIWRNVKNPGWSEFRQKSISTGWCRCGNLKKTVAQSVGGAVTKLEQARFVSYVAQFKKVDCVGRKDKHKVWLQKLAVSATRTRTLSRTPDNRSPATGEYQITGEGLKRFPERKENRNGTYL
jgi:hypothetical protein